MSPLEELEAALEELEAVEAADRALVLELTGEPPRHEELEP